MKKLIFLFFIFTSIVNAFDRNEFEVHVLSYHSNPVYKNNNYGLGYNYYFYKNLSWNIGVYNNSQDNTSYYTGVTYLQNVTQNLKLGVAAILATGYKDYEEKIGYVDVLVPQKTCTTTASGDTMCVIDYVSKKKAYTYEEGTDYKVFPMLGLVMQYHLVDNVDIKLGVSTDRYIDKTNPTDLVHLSFVVRF